MARAKSGRVVSINVSAGGVPKLPVPRARVTRGGVEGDRQRQLEFHGGPERAVCLYALERIEALRAEGHPVGPGVLGENVTTVGLDWDAVVVGARLEVGEALLEVASYAAPCRTIQRFFADLRFGRISAKTHPGWSRAYARVLREGEVREGDAVRLVEPVGPGAR